MSLVELKKLTVSDISKISNFGVLLNPSKTILEIENSLTEMFQFGNYHCFGLFQNGILVGISGGWITVRIYSGKQLEIDHFVIDDKIRSAGLGKQFVTLLEEWALKNNCKTVELNAYVQSERAHKFYFKMDYKILGFHFQKNIK